MAITQIRGNTQIIAGTILNAQIGALAAIDYSKLASLLDGNILVGNASNVPTSVNPSGDIAISNSGVFSISSDVIVDANINTAAAISTSKLADSANFILRGGSVAFTADQSMGNNKLTSLTDGVASGDAVNKGQLDAVGSASLTEGTFFVGNASNVPVELDIGNTSGGLAIGNGTTAAIFSMSGDVSMTSGGVTTIASGAVDNGKVNASAAIDYSKLATLTAGNLIVGNAGNVATSVNPSGDVDISATGVFSISSNVIINADINTGAAIDLSKLASGSSAQIIVANGSGVPTYVTMSGAATISNSGVVTISTPTLQDVYNASASDAIINLDASGSFHIKDNSGNTLLVLNDPTVTTISGRAGFLNFIGGAFLWSDTSNNHFQVSFDGVGQTTFESFATVGHAFRFKGKNITSGSDNPIVTIRAASSNDNFRFYANGKAIFFDGAGNEYLRFTEQGTSGVQYLSGVADDASAIGYVHDTVNVLSTSGAFHTIFRVNGNDVLTIDKAGLIRGGSTTIINSNLEIRGSATYSTNQAVLRLNTSAGIFLSGRANGIDITAPGAGQFMSLDRIGTNGIKLQSKASSGTGISALFLDASATMTSADKLVQISHANTANIVFTVFGDGKFTTPFVSIGEQGTDGVRLESNVTDSASAIGHVFDTANVLSNSAALLADFQNNGNTKLTIDKDGGIATGGKIGPQSGSFVKTSSIEIEGGPSTIKSTSGSLLLASAGTAFLTGSASVLDFADSVATYLSLANGGNSSPVYISKATDTVTTRAHIFLIEALQTADGSKLLTVHNQSTINERFFVDKDGALGKRFISDGTITAGHVVKIATTDNRVIETVTTDTNQFIGIAITSATVGTDVSVAFAGETAMVIADQAVTRGQFVIVSPATNGQVRSTAAFTAGNMIGVVLETTVSAGAFSMMIQPR